MKKIFSFTKKKKQSSGTPDNGSVLSVGYELKDKDLGKVHKAASAGDLAKLKQLAKKNDINQLDKENRTALHIACASGHAEVVQFLVESKAKLDLCDNQNRSALMKAVQCQHERCVNILLENHANPNLVDINSNTALHLAANIPAVSTAVLLLQYDAEINAQNKEGFTPLSVAVREDHIEMAEFLLKEGANVNFMDQNQRSPLMIAAGNGQISMVRLLLRFDADITLKDASGYSADDYAVMNGHHPCSHLIIEHGTQRKDGASLSHQGTSKKKKKMLGGHSQDAEAGFSLGGPATDRDEHGANKGGGDFDDNSQSESLSRVSKSAADEWPSSEDDEESLSTEKKRLKVNISKMMASKTTEAHSAAEKEKVKHSTHPSNNKTTLDSNEGSSGAEESEEELEGEEEEEEEEEDEEEEEEDDDDDEEEDDEDEEDDDEDEEDDDEEDEDSEDEDEEENEDESESVEDDSNGVAAVEKNTTTFEAQQKPSVSGPLQLTDGQKIQTAETTAERGASLGAECDDGDPLKKDAKRAISVKEPLSPAGPAGYALPAALVLEEDCVVSAIRVESKFSDEDDSQGREPSQHFRETARPSRVQEESEGESENQDGDPGSNEPNSGDTDWNDSDDEDNKIGACSRTALPANQIVLFCEAGTDNTDSLSKAGSNKNISKGEKRRSSWGSSLEDSDSDLPKENEVNNAIFCQESHAKSPDLPPQASPCKTALPQSNGDYPQSSRDFPSPFTKCVSPGQDKGCAPSAGLCSTNTAPSKNRPAGEKVEESDWDSSENIDQNQINLATGGQAQSLFSKACAPTSIQTAEHQGEHHEPFPEESTVPQTDDEARNQILDDDVERLSQKDGNLNSESWDDEEEESDDSEKQETIDEMASSRDAPKTHTFTPPNLSSQRAEGKKVETEARVVESNKELSLSVFDGNSKVPQQIKPVEENLVGVKTECQSKDDTSEDSDSMERNLQYDFISTKIKLPDLDHNTRLDGQLCGDMSHDQCEAKLTAYVKLDSNAPIVSHTGTRSGAFGKEATNEKRLSSPPADGRATAVQQDSSVADPFSDEALPQTDIDEVDLDSPDEAESTGFKWPEVTDIKRSEIQKEELTVDSSDKSDEEKEEEEKEGDVSDDPPEDGGEFNDTTLAVPDAEGSKEKKRDFLSELGLENGEEEQDTWDTESNSENSPAPHEERPSFQAPEERMTTPKEEIKEDGKVDDDDDDDDYDVKVGLGDSTQKEMERAKFGPLSVMSKLEGDPKTDLMEELGLGDVDDLEAQKADASDWDSASTASKRTLPGRRGTSPGLEEFPECSSSPVKNQGRDFALTAPQTGQMSVDVEKSPSGTPPGSAPHPQPRARKAVPQKPNSEEDSDCESDKITSGKTAQTDTQLQHGADPSPTVKRISPEPSPRRRNGTSGAEMGNQQQKTSKEATESAAAAAAVRISGGSGDAGGMSLEEVGSAKPEIRSGCLAGEAAQQQQQPTATKRMPAAGPHKIKTPEDVEMAEDFDELTQSSDTATDDIDSPTSGYRHASLLVQKLDLPDLDSRTKVKLQNIFHEYERSNQKTRSRCEYEADKVRQLEMERTELKSNLEEVKDVKSALERNQLELQTEVTNLKFHLKQEQENRRNATMMYDATRDKLRRMEEQHELEVQERQKVELTLRNQELEMRTLVNNMKQLEEDHSETQRLLAQERSARSLQENLLSTHLRKQQEIEDENKRHMSKSNEALSQLTEASDRERELVQQNASLQEQLTVMRAELEGFQANSSLKESHHQDEKEALKEQLEDTRRDLKLSNEALTQTVFSCDSKMTALKSELAKTTSRLESERQSREALEAEVESTRIRLAGAVKEAELCLVARTDVEKSLLREKEEHQRLKDKISDGAASQREAVSSLSQKLAKAEARANSMENEVHRVTLQLTEKSVLLEVLQREKDQASARVKEAETALQAEKEAVSRARASQEALQERLAQTQSEAMLLRQQLEESQNKGVAKERAVTDAQELFSDLLSKVRSDCEERVQLVEDRNKELVSKVADQREQICKLEEEKDEREANLRQLQQELADSLKRQSMSEASLEVNTRYRSDLEEEKTRLHKDLDRLKGKLQESEDQYMQAERLINGLKNNLNEKEMELTSAAQKLQEALSASGASSVTIKQLEEAVQRLEIENARLEAAAKQQSNKIDALQKGAQEAAMVRGHLEELVTNLQSSKMSLEDQLNREVQKQSMLSHTAQDSQALWEEELKSRSKLGLRLAELEKEKGELNTQMEIEKKKAKKIVEQKKAVDTRLDQEMKRNTELQKEMYRLRTLLKTAKKKLRDQDAGGAEFVSPMSSLRMDAGRHSQVDGGFGRMTDKVDDLQGQLEKEASRRSQLEKVNSDLRDQLASLKGLSRSNEQLERSRRQLEEEVLDLRRRMEASQVEQGQVEQYRRDADEKARQEVQQKLEQVNLFLQSQAASQEALDQIRAANEANLRSQLEQKIRELEGELGRARTTQQDSLNQRDSTRTELDRYRQLYSEELRLRKSLAAKLERANIRLEEANSKLLNERSRSLITSNIGNGSLGGASLDLGSLASPANYGATLGPLSRSLGLGLPLFSPMAEAQSSRVEDYLAKMQSELDKNISRELSSAAAELDVASARLSPVGSASRAELDPVSRATQQYLEVLKRNHMI